MILDNIKTFWANLKHAVTRTFRPTKLIPDEYSSYDDIREKLQTGDIIAVAKGTGVSFRDKIFGRFISRLTGYDIYHVGTILVIGERYFILEAIFPKVRLNVLSSRVPFYHIKLVDKPGVTATRNKFITRALSFVSMPYSLPDVVKAYWSNEVPKDNGVQCVELARYLARKYPRVRIKPTLIPGIFVQRLKDAGHKVTYVTGEEE